MYSATLSVFQLFLEYLTYFWNVFSVTWNVFSVIWNASSVNTIRVPVKKENLNVFGVVCLRTLKANLKLK